MPGFELRFRAPKSVSVLFGLGEPGIARQVVEAHENPIAAALDWAERHVVWSRRRRGSEQIRCEPDRPSAPPGLIGAALRHRTSRNGDPHLHAHVVVPNMVLGVDGRSATLDARWIYIGAPPTQMAGRLSDSPV